MGKDLSVYKSECHHGTAYTKMIADYSDIHTEALYYVPLNQTYEVWNLKVTNTSSEPRELTITGYAEFTNNNNYEQDQVNPVSYTHLREPLYWHLQKSRKRKKQKMHWQKSRVSRPEKSLTMVSKIL